MTGSKTMAGILDTRMRGLQKKESRGRPPAPDRPQCCAGDRLVGEVLNSICDYGDFIIFFTASHCGNQSRGNGGSPAVLRLS